jgi:toxin ParE1/3/4
VAPKVIVRPSALNDLAEIERWISERAGDDTATAYGDRILDACEALADFPYRGSPRGDLSRDIRTITFERSAIIAYVVQGDVVEVARILRRGRDIDSAINEN